MHIYVYTSAQRQWHMSGWQRVLQGKDVKHKHSKCVTTIDRQKENQNIHKANRKDFEQMNQLNFELNTTHMFKIHINQGLKTRQQPMDFSVMCSPGVDGESGGVCCTTFRGEMSSGMTGDVVFRQDGNTTEWWQLKYLFIFTPIIWGDDPVWLIFFKWVGSTTN